MTKNTQSAQPLTFYAVEVDSTLPKKFMGDVKAGFPDVKKNFHVHKLGLRVRK